MLTDQLATATGDVLLAAEPDLDRAVHHALAHAAIATTALVAQCQPHDGAAAITTARQAHRLRDSASLLPRATQAPPAVVDNVTDGDTELLTRKLAELIDAVHERCLDACLTADTDGYLPYSRVVLQSGRLAEHLAGGAGS